MIYLFCIEYSETDFLLKVGYKELQERKSSSNMLQKSENHNTLRRRVIKKPKIEHKEVKNEVHRI